ncbi:MAG: diguanylate cyclase, partial [Lachnospiraceae bacterium]|nr:diguanylate cyclase [Lachnospiraceae bacterium]
MQDYIYLIIIGVLFILSCALAGSRAKAVREKKAKAKELEDSLLNLDAVYSEVNTTQEELNAKYRELKDSEAKIKKLAYEDSLTGLPNKAAFMEVLGSALSTLRKNENIAVMHLDLDDFKEINGMWGEPLGDELILDISHRLKSNLDENDYLARSGSDEFYILTQNIEDIDAYEERVKKVQNTFRFPFMLSVNEFVITVSIGVAVAPRDGKSVATMLKHSDSALAEAKWLGKNTYCYYTEVIAQKEIEELELKSELTTAISEDAFFMEYQTVNEVQSGDLRALRVQLKWDRKEKGIWNAGKFTGFAERSGQIIPIGEYVLAGCCDEIKRREEAG